MSDIYVETIWNISASREDLSKLIFIENPEVADDIYKRYGSAVVMMGHQGNWEFIGGLSGAEDKGEDSFTNANYIVAYKKLSNKVIDMLIRKIRRDNLSQVNNGGDVVESKSIFRYMVKNRGVKNFYFFIADQSPAPDAKISTTFLHQPTKMFEGAEYLATKLNLPVLYMNFDRVNRGKYSIRFHLICEDPSSCKVGDITRRYAKFLEEGIEANKCNWLWSHKRWKR